MNNEPVAYWDGKEPNVLGLAYHQNDYCFIPLYTHPVKELTDEEILDASALGDTDIEALYMIEGVKEKIIQRGRAVLRKANEK